MRKRYVTRAVWSEYDEDGYISMTADTVMEAEDAPRPTGLLDADGNPLYSVRERIPFGFQGSK